MSKKVQVQLDFTANTSSAQQNLQSLAATLNQINNTTITVNGGALDHAVQSAKELQGHLAKAVDVNTGKLDFSALSMSLKNANTSLNEISSNLLALGPKGQQAFTQLASAVAQADLSIKHTNSRLKDFGVTLMNTIKWQMASTMIHAVSGAFSQAVTHVEKLDKALNGIQIVTNKTNVEMAAFAKRIQDASRALSATTTEYAEASLIYFQQGNLTEKEIVDRTEATIKLAKVTGDTMSTVSDQLTAIWNNFDNGTQSLEYYVDVITALGAATASSSDEIADGLQKFAAIAETVGLSYEYAATALATVTAETRQSADVVGTAFKTLFARIQGLNLGETLDDGTTLNKYSGALAKVGIDIKSANGELKDMNDILNEMGNRWQRLTEDQQVALAQAVGGMRQYTQLIALMDNWDTFKINLEIAEGSEGALNKQFAIYQDSVEASATELKNATESLYEDLLNPRTIKEFNEGLTTAVDLIHRLIENAGGLDGVLKFGGLLILQAVLPKMSTYLTNITAKIQEMTGIAQKERINTVSDMSQQAKNIAGLNQHTSTNDVYEQAQTVNSKNPMAMSAAFQKEDAAFTVQLLDTQKEKLQIEHALTATQKEQYNAYVKQASEAQLLLKLARERQVAESKTAQETSTNVTRNVNNAVKKQKINLTKNADQLEQQLATQKEQLSQYEEEYTNPNNSKSEAEINKMIQSMSKLNQAIANTEAAIRENQQKLAQLAGTAKQKDFSGEETKSMVAGFEDSAQSATGAVATENMLNNLAPGNDGTGPAASIENLEKLGQLQAQYNTDVNKAASLQTEIANQISLSNGSLAKTNKTMAQTQAASKNLRDYIKQYPKEFEAASKNSDSLSKTLNKIVNAGEKFSLEDLNEADLKNIDKMLNQVGEGLQEGAVNAKELGEAMATDMSNATDIDASQFDAVVNNARNAKAAELEAQQQHQRTVDTFNNKKINPDVFNSITTGLGSLVQGYTNFAMGTQMASTGLNTILDENAGAVEKLMGTMMALQAVMNIVNATTAVKNGLDKISLGLKQANTVATLQKAAAEHKDAIASSGLIGKLYHYTSALVTNALAKVMSAEASKGLAGILLGVAAAAIIMSTVYTQQNTKALQKEADAKANVAEKSEEAAKSAREELNTIIELTQAYNELLDTYKNIGEGKSELIDKALEVAQAMEIEGAAALILAGRYDELNDRINAKKISTATETVKTSAGSLLSSGDAFLAAENVEGSGGLWTTEVDGEKYLTLDLGSSADDETALQMWIASNPNSPWQINGSSLAAKYQSGSDIPYLLKSLVSLRQGVSALAAANGMDTTRQEFFSEIAEMDESGTWQKAEETAGLYDSHIDTVINAQKLTTLNATNQQDYTQQYEQIKANLLQENGVTDPNSEKGKELIQALNKNLLNDKIWKNFELQRQGLDEITSQSQVAQTYLNENLQDWADEYAEGNYNEALELFLKISPQYYDSTDEIDEAMSRMQSYLDSEKLIVKYDLISGALDGMKETMSSEEWSNFYEQNKDLFDPESSSYIGMSFQDFASQNYDDRQQILNDQKGSTAEERQNQLTQKKQELINAQVNRDITLQQKYNEIEAAARASQEEFDKKWGTSSSNFEVQEGANISNYDAIAGLYDASDRDKVAQAYGYASFAEMQATYMAYQKDKQDNAFATDIDTLKAQAESETDNYISGLITETKSLESQLFLDQLAEKDKPITDVGLEVSEVNEYIKVLQEMAATNDENDGIADDLTQDSKAAQVAAISMARYNRAIDKISKSYNDWKEALSSDSIVEQTDTMNELKDVYADMLDLESGDSLSSEFLKSTEALQLMEEAANGNAEAYKRLQQLATKAIIEKATGQEVSQKIQTILDEIAAMEPVDVGAKIQIGESNIASTLRALWDETYNAIIQGGGDAAAAMKAANEAVAAAGYESQIQYEEQTEWVRAQVPAGWKPDMGTNYRDPTTGQTLYGVEWEPQEGQWYEYPVKRLVPITGKGGAPSTFIKKAGMTGGSVAKKDGGGGGGDKKATKKSDIVERYKEINDELADTQRKMDKASSIADTLWGADRFAKMQEGIDLLREENEELERKAELQKEYLKEDRAALDEAAAAAGIQFTYDPETGAITNYTEQMTSLYDQLKAAEDAGNTAEVERIQALIDAITEAISQYEETIEIGFEIDEEQLNNAIKISEQTIALINEKMEIKIKVNDRELKKIEYYLSKIEDDFYQMGEAAALMSDKFKSYQGNLEAYEKAKQEAYDAWVAGDLTDADYYAKLEELHDQIYDDLQAIDELDKAMMSYYSDTIAASGEEIAKYTDQMEHATSVLEHYQSILELTGRSNDYDAMGEVLRGKSQTTKNEMDAAKAKYDLYAGEVEAKKALYDKAMAEGNEAAAEQYKKEYEAALAAAQEAQDEFLSKAEAYAESLKAVLENSLAGFAQDLENALTGGTSFDQLTTQMERAASLQEEYLTTTNKIYETNKLMRTAQQEIDKSSNSVAKRRLKQFISETQSMQEQNKLSKFELEIQQAKYDLLLAEIALEEAQNAKSTVRLQRDSEGNLSYVYTADTSKVAEAQQSLEDAQNALYNIGLEGANSYTEKYQQTLNEMYDTLTDLQSQYLEGAFESEEEYHAAVEAAKSYYYEKLEQYSSLYGVAVQADSRVAQDAWSTEFASMTTDTESWKLAVETYIQEVSGAFAEWEEAVENLTVLTNLTDISGAVSGITSESEELLKLLTGEGGIIDTIKSEFDEVSKVTSAWANQRDTLKDVITHYEDLAASIQNVLDLQAQEQNNNNGGGSGGEGGGSGGEGGGSGSGGEGGGSGNGSGPGGDNNNSGGGACSNCGNSPCTCNQKKSPDKFGWNEGNYPFTTLEALMNNAPWEQLASTDAVPIYAKRSDTGAKANSVVGALIDYDANRRTFNIKQQFPAFDTGGYTGSWGSYGKMAMLHEKELILNAHDTENFLASMELLHRIIEIIDLHSMNAQIGGLLSSPSYRGDELTTTLDQNVHIEASFPGVSDRYELEEAFNNLINTASQYANRKN